MPKKYDGEHGLILGNRRPDRAKEKELLEIRDQVRETRRQKEATRKLRASGFVMGDLKKYVKNLTGGKIRTRD